MTPEQTVESRGMLQGLPIPIVFDHLGGLSGPAAVDNSAYEVIRRLIDKGRTLVKLSVAHISKRFGPPTYADTTPIARAYVKAAPGRLVWGSGWPHQSIANKPNDAVLFDLLTTWAPDESVRNRILVTNPEVLHSFSKY